MPIKFIPNNPIKDKKIISNFNLPEDYIYFIKKYNGGEFVDSANVLPSTSISLLHGLNDRINSDINLINSDLGFLETDFDVNINDIYNRRRIK